MVSLQSIPSAPLRTFHLPNTTRQFFSAAITTHHRKGRLMTDYPPLDKWRLDALLNGPEKIWGVKAIAEFLGVSESKVRRMAKRPTVPIYRPAGMYFAFRSELTDWLRSK